jgi:hypothetical protein
VSARQGAFFYGRTLTPSARASGRAGEGWGEGLSRTEFNGQTLSFPTFAVGLLPLPLARTEGMGKNLF